MSIKWIQAEDGTLINAASIQTISRIPKGTRGLKAVLPDDGFVMLCSTTADDSELKRLTNILQTDDRAAVLHRHYAKEAPLC